LQGMEKEVILFSPTYTSLKNQEYLYDRDPYILNIAVSRAKQSFLIFGDMNCFGVQADKASAKLKAVCIDATDQLNVPEKSKSNIGWGVNIPPKMKECLFKRMVRL